jgi:hypothetical protein
MFAARLDRRPPARPVPAPGVLLGHRVHHLEQAAHFLKACLEPEAMVLEDRWALFVAGTAED